MSRRFVWAILAALLVSGSAAAQSVELAHEDAEVWAERQTVRGTVTGLDAATGVLRAGADAVAFDVTDDAFAATVHLEAGTTPLVACVEQVCSDTLRLTLGYRPRPEAALSAEVNGRRVALRGTVLENPGGDDLAFAWRADPDNPSAVALEVATDSLAHLMLPESAPEGEYYVDWTVTDADGDAFTARTFVTATDTGLVAFDIDRDHAAWIDRAVVYALPPRLFADYKRGRLEHVTARLPELADLGVNTLWLQPIHPYGDAPTASQMYDVTDYFAVWHELGTEADLHRLVDAAHALGMRVILDFVPNHSSIAHPYAQQAIAHGERSHYYDFYMRESDGAPYAQNYDLIHEGEMTFVSYFWPDLVTWDYDNPEVERLITEASRYWIEHFDVDGYRFDAVWGPHARDPAFTRRWRRAMKRVKPEVLLLAEAKAPYSEAYVGTGHPDTYESFDLAYDWSDSDDCISRWMWARHCDYSAYEEGPMRTIFNSGVTGLRARDLRNALTNFGRGYPEGAVVFRFIENNDLPVFRAHHTAEQTRMAAALLFALDGVPSIYYSQPVGRAYPNENRYPSYPVDRPLAFWARDGFWDYYRHLIALRTTFAPFTSDTFAEVPVGPAAASGHTFAFRRWSGEEHVLAALNMADEAVDVALRLPAEAMGLEAGAGYHLTDLFTGESRPVTGATLDTLAAHLPPHTTRLWLLADRAVTLPTDAEMPAPIPSRTLVLHAAFPNPFRDAVTLSFETPAPGPVRLAVYDVLGRRVALPVDGPLPAGRHTARLDGRGLAAGLYLVRLQHAGAARATTVVRVR